jgi:hypothetical protein
MNMNKLFAACAALLLLVGVSTAAGAAGPTKSVRGGESVEVDTAGADITISGPQQYGRVEKVPPAAAGQPFILKYTANNTTTPVSETITYRVANETADRVATVYVEPTVSAQGFSGTGYDQAARALFLLFVLAVLLESGLAILFNWKPFVEYMVPRAVRPVIALIGAIILVRLLEIDIVTSLANALNGTHLRWSPEGQILTAMVIAGGSAGVNTMLVALGFRSVQTPATATPKPPPDKAWLSVRALKGDAVGDLLVFAGPPTGSPALIGVIKGRSSAHGFWAFFFSDPGRLPSYGGHTMQPDQDYVIEVRGKNAAGMPLPPKIFGPLKFAKGAIVDFDVTL